jgi:polyketide biosynthesis enoyl-CoA hydratase PksI
VSAEPLVDLSDVAPGVVQMTMQDRAGKNAFNGPFVSAVLEAFDTIASNTQCRAVVLTGFDTYFASGGSRESLLLIHEGGAKFSDTDLYARALKCPVPVISAMQGHAIGGGFVFGLFADVIVLGLECIYTTNFMKYGFTPGMGATCVLPEKVGLPLSQEMLLGARTYRGEELRRRGVPFTVLPRKEVLGHGLEIAREIAQKPRPALVLLKRHLTARLRQELPRHIQGEVEMHKVTFHEPDVRARIDSLFGQ